MLKRRQGYLTFLTVRLLDARTAALDAVTVPSSPNPQGRVDVLVNSEW
jgi:hypothetical protein